MDKLFQAFMQSAKSEQFWLNFIVSVLVTVIGAVLAAAIIAVFGYIGKKVFNAIRKEPNPHPEENVKREKLKERIKDKTATLQDAEYIISLIDKKVRINRYEKRYLKEMNDALNGLYRERVSNAMKAFEELEKVVESVSKLP